MGKAYKHTLFNDQKETAYEISVSEPIHNIKLSSESYRTKLGISLV